MTKASLSDAVAAGIIDAEQAERLVDYLDNSERLPSNPDDETFRLILGFNDIFVSIGILLVFSPLMELPWLIAIGAWGLGEIFTIRRRMALPSILLAILFACASAQTAVSLTYSLGFPLGHILRTSVLPIGLLPSLVMVAGALLHFRRFHVPIDICLAAAASCIALYSALELVAPSIAQSESGQTMAMLCFGGALFALAMRYDMSDPQRVTIRADIAFWLHLAAAPLLIHGALGGVILSGADLNAMGATAAMAILLGAGCVAFVALMIDRRAMIVSSLVYVGAAIYRLLGAPDSYMSAVALLLGLAVLLLSLWWRPLRAMSLSWVPDNAFKRSLPPLRP